MTRATILYGGHEYVVARDEEQVRVEVDELIADGGGWLSVNHGRGRLQPAHLWVDRGVSIAVIDTTQPE
ncbi:hypothetical protein [Microcella sp.]|uniref:hypothetical protein n=1 Tax=Microcella sp. TaxID=1913979 RepID=UPI00391DB469